MSFWRLRGLATSTVIALSFLSLADAGPNATMYPLQRAPLFTETTHGSAIGFVMPGAAITASGSSGAYRDVTFDGWSQQGDSGTIVTAPGVRIIIAELTASARVQTIGSTHDAYGNAWTHVVVTAAVRANALTADQDVVWNNAKAIFTTRCSACHALHKPAEFTANQWPAILKTMEKNAALQPDQAALVTQYLQAHAK